MILRAFAFFILFLSVARASVFDYHGYFRAGVGSNLKGGQQECLGNSGASAFNEFRVGNECSVYGEASLSVSDKVEALDWKAITTFAYTSDERTDWEINSNPWVLREVYVDGSLSESGHRAWVGKRYFRWNDIYYLDFYTIDFSGPGAGLVFQQPDKSVYKVAIIQGATSKEFGGSGTTVPTTVGSAAKTTLHFLSEGRELGSGKAQMWALVASTPAAKSTVDGTDYRAGTGALLAFKWTFSMESNLHELAAAVGQGVVSNFSLAGELIKNCGDESNLQCTVLKSHRERSWWRWVHTGTEWSWESALVAEFQERGTSVGNRERWLSGGALTTYQVDDHLQWLTMMGLSNVLDESDGKGSRNLWRITTGPQWAWKRGFWSRPVLRAYLTHSGWNENNRSYYTSSGLQDSYNTTAVGFQTEIWF